MITMKIAQKEGVERFVEYNNSRDLLNAVQEMYKNA